MNILFICSWFPYPPDNGSRIRSFNLIKALSKKHRISLMSFRQSDVSGKDIESLKEYCNDIKAIYFKSFNPKSFKAFWGFFNLTTPRSLIDIYNKEMQENVCNIIKDQKIDLIICTEPQVVLYARKFKKIPKIYSEVEYPPLPISRGETFKDLIIYKLRYWKSVNFLKKILSEFDGYGTASEITRQKVSEINSSILNEIIPNGVDIPNHSLSFIKEQKNTIIYSGSMTYGANYDAMEYFLGKIYPLIRKEIKDIKLKITGSIENVDINKLKADNSVELTGYVNDIKSLIISSDVCIVPLRVGGGTRLKIVEAMALGTPVVSTSKGAEGIEGLKPVLSSGASTLEPGTFYNIWIEDEPENFAKGVVELLKNREFAEQMAINARKLVEERYDWKMIGEKFGIFIEKVIEKKKNSI
ncbi:MAG: glycosyltransferase family 4 protein [bacterium]